ncbi:MAG: DUF1624 domain-containing protein [Epulopiscium sp.]|nr:DUF1624 domain-containing protein [Candidatus Epulonipiscium sp.]
MVTKKVDPKQHSNRIVEIDFFRGIAIILMMLFHFLYDLQVFYNINIPSWNQFWYYEGKLSAILFMLLSGISCTLSKNNLKRGFKVFLIGMLLTIGSYILMPEEYIRFGILHLLGLSMILLHFIKVIPPVWTGILSVIIIILGSIMSLMTVNTWILSPLGLIHGKFNSMDYYPLFPWFGVFLIGTVIGRIVYKEKKSIFHKTYKNGFFNFLGRHSLFIYLIHQPIFLIILYVVFHFIFNSN